MKLTGITRTVPPGFADNNIEFFVKDGEPVFLQGGTMHDFGELDIEEAENLRQLLDQDKKALRGLALLEISNPIEQLKKFVICRFGTFDMTPDIADDEIHYEYWDCGCRNICPAEGILCLAPQVHLGKLTPHELKLIGLIRSDIPNKQIADIMHVSVHTVNRECSHIAGKIGCVTKTGIAAFAGEHNIH
jgi:DNA-binding CsgD family transcriptional regulator